MRSLGIKALQTNPALLTRSLENGEYTLITKHGHPLGIAAAFDETILDHGFRRWLLLKAFREGDLSLGELARGLGKTREATLTLLGDLGIPVAAYPLAEELANLEDLGL